MIPTHRRYNALTDEWILVSAGRTKRPWQGLTEDADEDEVVSYDPNCYLCPSNTRITGDVNPPYESTFSFTNDFAALQPDIEPISHADGLLRSESQSGTCRVLCYSPRHDLRMSLMTPSEIETVIDLWREQTADLGERYRWVQVFENSGEAMGASNPHPHGQVWAGSAIPTTPAREDSAQLRHRDEHGSLLLLDYLAQESDGDRIVIDGEHWTALVPYWATWPFETIVIPKDPIQRMTEVDGASRSSLADVLNRLLTRYDNLFAHPFPYSMGWHGAPFTGGDTSHWQLHAHFFPPLLRSATVRKFMVGYELLAEAQRDLTPEEAAGRLRELPSDHYTVVKSL
ncbi:MAG: UDP-glucose--hexose-1-phosphate uridylyltransferase [Actinomycetota bacterium]